MGRVSGKLLGDMEAGGAPAIKRWIRVAIEEYLYGKKGKWAFIPFEHIVGATDSLAGDIALLWTTFSPAGKDDAEHAIVEILEELPPDPKIAEIWRVLIELAWIVPVSRAVGVLEQRFTPDFFDALCVEDEALFHEIFVYAVNTGFSGKECKRCIMRLIDSPRFDARYSRHVLLRLCEVDPDDWPRHFGLIRDALHRFFYMLSEADVASVQGEIAEDLLRIIGVERLAAGLHRLAADPWLIDAFNRTGAILWDGEGTIAPANKPLRRARIETATTQASHREAHWGGEQDLAGALLAPPGCSVYAS